MSECPDHFVFIGEDHLRHIVSAYIAWYNTHRPLQAKDNRPLTSHQPPEPAEALTLAVIACEEQLGSLLKHSHHKAG